MSRHAPLVFAGNDLELVRQIQQQLNDAVASPIDSLTLESLRDQMGLEAAGLVVLIASRPADRDAVRALVREIRLRNLSPRLMVLETEEAMVGRDLADLDSHIDGRLCWPDHTRGILSWIKRNSDKLEASPSLTESSETEIGRRLLQYTPTLEPMLESLTLAAAHDVTVLIDGETGTGKTFLARLLHDNSPRRQERFVAVPCGALAANLVESEFFGHVKGAFTGADAAKVGKFAAAGKGTLLLDEIDALGLEQQANLLRVIETGEYEPVGSNETQICQARIIVATNWNLEAAVERGQFRRDLYYRLNVMPFCLPALRDRPRDIEPLARGLIARFANKFRKELFSVQPEVFGLLEAFPWPGNIRQLENALQQAVLMNTGPELREEHLPPLLRQAEPRRVHVPSLVRQRETSERSAVQRALEESGYCRARAARALGVSRVTLYKKMRKYGLLARPFRSAAGPQAASDVRAAIA